MNHPRLMYLYQLYIDNNCTAEELQDLEVLLRNKDNEQDFKKLLDITWDQLSTSQPADISFSKADQIYSEIIQNQSGGQQRGHLQEQLTGAHLTQHSPEQEEEATERQLRRPDYRLWIGIAASLILILSITIAFYKHTPYNHAARKSSLAAAAKKPLAADILPGTEKAILTLSNGRRVMLGKSQNGQIAKLHRMAVTKGADSKLADQNTIAIPLAGQYHLTLPDGTLVYLNSASTLSYPTKFSGNARVVTLIGEAYFEVTKNPKMPFRVNVNGGQQIEVLGTHFNVKAYPDEQQISTTLFEGSVKVTSGNGQVMLKPGQAAINDPSKPLTVKPADLDEVMAWKNGMFIFNNESITDIMKKISRWYDVEVVFKGNVENINFTGNYSRSKSLSSLLQNIELMEKVHFIAEGRRITVIEK